jgi:hypothetical protein
MDHSFLRINSIRYVICDQKGDRINHHCKVEVLDSNGHPSSPDQKSSASKVKTKSMKVSKKEIRRLFYYKVLAK